MRKGCKLNLSPFTLHKIRKALNKNEEKYMPKERRQNLAEADRGSFYSQAECLEEFLDNKGAFSNGRESDDSDNDNKNYNEKNEQHQSSEGFASTCYKTVSPILSQELINDLVCKHCSGAVFLLLEDVASIHDFGKCRTFHVKKRIAFPIV